MLFEEIHPKIPLKTHSYSLFIASNTPEIKIQHNLQKVYFTEIPIKRKKSGM